MSHGKRRQKVRWLGDGTLAHAWLREKRLSVCGLTVEGRTAKHPSPHCRVCEVTLDRTW